MYYLISLLTNIVFGTAVRVRKLHELELAHASSEQLRNRLPSCQLCHNQCT